MFGPRPRCSPSAAGSPRASAALATGGALVSAMVIQNAVHRVRLASLPPSTVMTGTTTQVMVDLADVLLRAPSEKRAAAKKRLGPMSLSVAAFAGAAPQARSPIRGSAS